MARAPINLASGRNTFSPPCMSRDRQGRLLYVDGLSRGFIWNGTEENAGSVQLGIKAPTAGATLATSSSGAFTYYTAYRYFDRTYGTPSSLSPLRSITGSAVTGITYTWTTIQQPLDSRADMLEFYRSIADDTDTYWQIYQLGISKTVSITESSGYCLLTSTAAPTAHGWEVGDKLILSGGSVTDYNTEHTITRVVQASPSVAVITDVGYTADSAGHTAQQRVYRFRQSNEFSQTISTGGFAELQVSATDVPRIGGSAAATLGATIEISGGTVADGPAQVTGVRFDGTNYFITTNFAFAGPTEAVSGNYVITGMIENYADSLLDDMPQLNRYQNDGDENAYRFTIPPTDRAVVCMYRDRAWYAVGVEYNAGTVATTSASRTVTGTSTAWPADVVGRYLYVRGQSTQYLITARASATSITIDAPATASVSGASYTISPHPSVDNQLRYSFQDEPESCPTTYTVTIQENVHDHDKLTGLAAMGSALYCLKERHIYRLTFAKQPRIDANVTLVAERGCVNNRAWDQYEGQMYLLDQLGPWRFGIQGGGTDDLDLPISDFVRDFQIDWTKSKWFFTKINPEEKVCRFFVTLVGDNTARPTRALCYNIKTGQWWTESWTHMLGGACDVNMMGRVRTLVGGEEDLVFALNDSLGDLPPGDSGVATSSSSTTIVNSGESWATNQWANGEVRIVSGTGAGQVRTVSSNTSTALTVSVAWHTNPDTTSRYVVIYPVTIGTATSGSTTSVTDSTASWVTNQWAGASVAIYQGTGNFQWAKVVSNTATALTILPPYATTWTAPASGSLYAIGGILWQMKTGLKKLASQLTEGRQTHDTDRSLFLTYTPTTNATNVDLRIYHNHDTTPETIKKPYLQEKNGITGNVGDTHWTIPLKLTRSSIANAPGSIVFQQSSGRAGNASDGDRWIVYEFRGCQHKDRLILHALVFTGVE